MAEYIEREAVRNMLENAQIISDYDYYGYCTEDVCLDKIPTADVVEVQHRAWLPQLVSGERAWVCNGCKTLGSPRWIWCPVCGAKMDGKGDGE